MIVLRFAGGRSWRDQVVKAATWSWCSHVDIEMADGRLLGAVPGRGVCLHEVEIDDARVERYGVRLPTLLDEELVIQCAWSQLRQPYDWPGVLGWGLRRNWQEPDSWFCSELVAWAFQQAHRPLLRAEQAWRITPRDLLLSPYLIPLEPLTTAIDARSVAVAGVR